MAGHPSLQSQGTSRGEEQQQGKRVCTSVSSLRTREDADGGCCLALLRLSIPCILISYYNFADSSLHHLHLLVSSS